MTKLRDYQSVVVDEFNQALKDGAKSILIVSPTGSGKTKMVSKAIKGANLVPLAISHRVEICNQIRREFADTGIDRFWVRGIQASDTLRMSINENVINAIFIDEAHHLAAHSYQRVIKMRGKKLLIGATATPYRADGASIVSNFDKVIYAPTHKELVDRGYLAHTEFVSAIDIDFDEVKDNIKGDYEAKGCLDKIRVVIHAGDIVKQLQSNGCGAGTIIYAVNIEHCALIENELRDHGLVCKSITSRTKKDDRKQMIMDFQEGLFDYLINCEVLTEGTDIKKVNNIVMIRPTKSLVLYKQMIGRGVRPDSNCKVVDLVGNVSRFGDVFSTHHWKRDKVTSMSIKSSSITEDVNSSLLLHLESVECDLKPIVPVGIRRHFK